MVIHELSERLHGLSADILFLQEVQGVNDRHAGRYRDWPVKPQHEFIADTHLARSRLRQERHLPPRPSRQRAAVALSRSSRRRTRTSPRTRSKAAGLLHCVIKLGDEDAGAALPQRAPRPVRARPAVADPRAGASGSARRCPQDAPLVIAGDFNDWRHKADRALDDELGVVRGVRGGEGAPGAHVSLGACRCSASTASMRADSTSSTRACTTRFPAARISDHAALAATFELPRKRK